MDKIKITHIISAGGIGGGEKYLLIFAKYLDRQRFTLDFILPERGALYERLQALGYSPKVIEINRSLLSREVLSRLSEYLKSSSPQIVHTHGARSNFYGRLASFRAGIPSVMSTVHNSIKDYPVSALRKSIYMKIEKYTASKVSLIVTVSDYLRQSLIRDYGIPEGIIETVYPCIDFRSIEATQSAAETRKSLSIPQSAVVITQAGRMTKQKGFECFIDAASKIRKNYDNTYFLFAGDGPERESLEERCRERGIYEKCLFCGFRDDMGNIMQASDIVVSPSLSEGFPVTMLEAAYFEKPVIASNVSGIPEFICDKVNGILIPPADSDALANALKSLICEEALRDKLGIEAKKKVSEKFSPDYMLDKFSEIYEKLAKMNL